MTILGRRNLELEFDSSEEVYVPTIPSAHFGYQGSDFTVPTAGKQINTTLSLDKSWVIANLVKSVLLFKLGVTSMQGLHVEQLLPPHAFFVTPSCLFVHRIINLLFYIGFLFPFLAFPQL